MKKMVYKSRTNKKLDGVCGGIAEWLEVDPAIIRLFWLLLSFNGYGIIFYLTLSLALSYEDEK